MKSKKEWLDPSDMDRFDLEASLKRLAEWLDCPFDDTCVFTEESHIEEAKKEIKRLKYTNPSIIEDDLPEVEYVDYVDYENYEDREGDTVERHDKITTEYITVRKTDGEDYGRPKYILSKIGDKDILLEFVIGSLLERQVLLKGELARPVAGAILDLVDEMETYNE